ncbi:MAG: iron ABC transporter permease [Bacillus thermozeamaize]|uniref:Iron ABC transporter permease n=1 Tax=Bacillus thermozeamaize TaxID=230954 RepID=A0A1Y3PLL8_9BACI|nr:MAG: iron ABC transporter permease [Bacillus thermozeamaize]
MKKRHLVVALFVLSVTSLFVGVKEIKLSDLLNLSESHLQVLFVSRVPRLISLIIAGASMGIIGLIMQQLSRNKFVSPTTAGTEDAARFGILVSMMIFSSSTLLQKMVIAFLFALLGTFIFMKILDRVKFKNAIFIPLVGLMYGSIIDSVTTFFAYQHNLIQSIGAWLYGDFSMIVKGRYELLYVSIPLLIIAYLFADRFTIAGMGEDFSVNLGLNYRQVVNVGLVIVALVTAVVILTVGMMPFLGLIIPNIVTLYRGDHLRQNIVYTALLGAVFLLGCDILGRLLIYPYEIPIGLMVGVIGSATFLSLLLRRKMHE